MSDAAETLGARLLRAREARGLSQQALGDLVGMRQQAIAAIEAGNVQRPRKLREIARAIGVSEGFLLGEASMDSGAEQPGSFARNIDEVGASAVANAPKTPSLLARLAAIKDVPHDRLEIPAFLRRAALEGGGIVRDMTVIPIHEAERNDPSTDAGEDRTLGYSPSIAGAIPEIDVEVGTGDGTVGQVLQIATKGGAVSGHMINHEWVIPSRAMDAPVAHVIAMPVVGSSMEPTLRAGDTVFVDLRLTAVKSTEIYVIDEEDGPMAKRVRINRDVDPAVIEISSDNPTVKPFTRPAEFVRVIGRVVGKFSKL